MEFARMPGGVVAKGQRFGVSKSSVSNWCRGDTQPNDAIKERIFEAGGPDPAAWDEVWKPGEGAGDVELPSDEELGAPPAADQASVAEAAAFQLAQIQKLQRELAAPGGMADMRPDERVRLQLQVSDAIGKLAAFTGVKLTHRMILASPLWHELIGVITVALEPYPEALKAVAEAVDGLKPQ